MPINNKGRLNLSEVVRRQVDRDWPAANTDFDLFVQDLIASGNVVANGLIIRNIEVSDSILTGTITANTLTLDTITANTFVGIDTDQVAEGSNLYYTNSRVVTAVTPLLTTANIVETSNLYYTDSRVVTAVTPLLTTANIVETSNLYFTLARARGVFTEGSGIAISANGVISTRGDDTGLGLFNSGINLAANLKPTGTYETIRTFPSVEGNTFIVFSFLATNRSYNTSYVSARVNTGGNTIMMANLLRLPPNSSTEIFRKPQVFKISDYIQIQSFDQDQTPAANLINTYISYQATLDDTFNRSAISISDNQAHLLYQSEARTAIVESLNLVNLGPNVMPVDAYITNNANQLVTYLVSNLLIPPHTSVEICEYPKALLDNDKIWIHKWDNPRELAVFVSSKTTSSFEVTPSATVIVEGDTITFDIVTTNVLDGTVLFYELQQV